MSAKEQEVLGLLSADLVDVHVDLPGGGAHHAVSRLAEAKFVASVQKLVEVGLFGRDVLDGDENVDDRLRRQSRH